VAALTCVFSGEQLGYDMMSVSDSGGDPVILETYARSRCLLCDPAKNIQFFSQCGIQSDRWTVLDIDHD
jgi:hypothetical protein